VNSTLNEFFKQERQQIWVPPPDFSRRVMARLPQKATPQSLWDNTISASRPILAVAFILLLALIGLEILTPVRPSRGPTQIFIELEVPAAEQVLYFQDQTPATSVVLDQMIIGDLE
jgi:hypothetical protein